LRNLPPLAAAVFACLLFIAGPVAEASPFGGTIFIDPDIITSADATTSIGVTDQGTGQRWMFDRRVNNFVFQTAYLFEATFSDGLAIEVQVNLEFGSAANAQVEALKYATVVGRLPTVLRVDVETMWIHQGVQPFGGGNNNLLIHTGQSASYEAAGILEETFVHEAAHTSLDAAHAASPGWLQAQLNDPDFISDYAHSNPTQEDIAESFLTWLAVRHRADRISASLYNTILSTIPNRLAYFDQQNFDMFPIVQVAAVPEPSSMFIFGGLGGLVCMLSSRRKAVRRKAAK
jgi:hypothetical protein